MQITSVRAAIALVILAALSHPAMAQTSNPTALLAEADRLAMLCNWPRAIPLYTEAGKEFHNAGNAKSELQARLGWIRTQAYQEPSAALAAEVEEDLRNPVIQGDTPLRLRCLLAKAAIEEQANEDSSRQTWEKILALAKGLGDRRWQARAELGIIDFLDGDVAKAT